MFVGGIQMDPQFPSIVQEIYHGHSEETRANWQNELADPDTRKALENWLTMHAGSLALNPAYSESCLELLKSLTVNANVDEDGVLATITSIFRATVPGFDQKNVEIIDAEASKRGLQETRYVLHESIPMLRELTDPEELIGHLSRKIHGNDTLLHLLCRSEMNLDEIFKKIPEKELVALLRLKGNEGWKPWMLLLSKCQDVEEISKILQMIPMEDRLEDMLEKGGWLRAVSGQASPPPSNLESVANLILGALKGVFQMSVGPPSATNRPTGFSLLRLYVPQPGDEGHPMNQGAILRAGLLLQDLSPDQLNRLLAAQDNLLHGLIDADARELASLFIQRADPYLLMAHIGLPVSLSGKQEQALEDLLREFGSEKTRSAWADQRVDALLAQMGDFRIVKNFKHKVAQIVRKLEVETTPWMNYYMEPNPAHLTLPIAELELGKTPEDATIQDLTELFDQINWKDPASPGYKDPLALTNDEGHVSVEELKQHLSRLLYHAGGEPLTGIPNRDQNPDAFKEYMDDLNQRLIHIAHDVREQNERAQAMLKEAESIEDEGKKEELKKNANVLLLRSAKALIDCARAGKYCGTRFFSDVDEACLSLKEEGVAGSIEQLKLDQKILRRLRDLRFEILREIIQKYYQGNVHLYNQYMELIGGELGIKRKGGSYREDPYWVDWITRDMAIKDFNQEYTVQRIMDAVSETIHASQALRELTHDWLMENDWRMENGVAVWNPQKWNPILKSAEEENAIEKLAQYGINYVSGDPESVLQRNRERAHGVNFEKASAELDAAERLGILALSNVARKYGITSVRKAAEAKKALQEKLEASERSISTLEGLLRRIRQEGLSREVQKEKFAKLHIEGYHPEHDLTPLEFVKELRARESAESLYYPSGHHNEGRLKPSALGRLLEYLQIVKEQEDRKY